MMNKANLSTLTLALSLAISAPAHAQDEVNIYSYRQPDLIAPVLAEFTKETGIKTNVLFLDKGLVERIKAEGENSPADVIMTVDIGRLVAARDAGITQPVKSDIINANIPANYRDSAGHYFSLTTRGRVVYASKDRVNEDKLSYEDLADPKWKGRICVRSGQHNYNIGLFASLIAHDGADAFEKWLTALRDNLARRPQGNDRAQAKGIFTGECDIGIGNTYYVGLMQTNDKQPEQKDWAKSIKVIFPNNETRGTHVNVSGMVMAKHAPHEGAALKLMEFLSSGKAQEIYAEQVFEYPVKPGAKPSQIVAGFGELHPDQLPLEELAKYRKLASELVDKVGFDDGPTK